MATEKIYEALVGIRADSQQLRADLQRAQTELRGGLLSLGNLARSLAPALTLGGVGAFLNHVADIGDQLSDLADQTGVSIGVLGGIKPVLDASNSSLEGFARGFVRFQRSLGDITGDGKQAAEALQAIGLNVNEIAKLSPDDAIERLVAALGKVEDRNTRLALATRLFSRAGAELIPTINQLAETGIPRLDRETEQAYKQLGALKDQLVILSGAFANLAAGPLAKTIEGFKELFGIFSESAKLDIGLGRAADEFDAAAKRLGRIQALKQKGFGFFAGDENAAKQELDRARQALADLGAARGKLAAADNRPKPTSNVSLPSQDLKKSGDESRSFIQSLEKQADALRQNQVELTQGATAAKAYGLELEFAAFKQKLIEDGKPIPAGLDGGFARVKAVIIDLTEESDRLKASLEQSFSARRFAEEEQEFAAIAAEQKKNLEELNRATEEGIRIRATVPADLQQQLVRNIEAQLAKEKEEAAFLSTVYGPSFERAAADVEALKKAVEALKNTGIGGDNATALQIRAELDRRTLDRNLDELRRSEIVLSVQARLGLNVDILGPQIEALRRQLQERIGQFGSANDALADPIVRALGGQLKDKVSDKEFADLRKELELAGKQAQVFGADFDGVGAALGATQRAIENLLREGLDPLDPRIEELRGNLEKLKGLESIQNAFDGLADSIGEAFLNIGKDGEKFGDSMRNLMIKIAQDLQREIIQQLVVSPLKNLLRGLLNDVQTSLSGALSSLGNNSGGFGNIFGSLFGGLFGGGSSSASSFASSVDVGSFFSFVHSGGFVNDDGSIQRFKGGGNVLGFGEVPAILHAGEFVLRKAIVDAIGVDALQRINRGGLPAFETGGLVMASNPIRSARPADLRQQTTDSDSNRRRAGPEVRVEVNGSIIKNPNIPDEQVIRVWAKDYRGYGVTRAIVKGDR